MIFVEAFPNRVPGNKHVRLQIIMLEFSGSSDEISNGICEFGPTLQQQECGTSVGSRELSNAG